MKMRHKTEYSHAGVYYAILVLPIFSYSCMRGFVSQQSGVLGWNALALRAHFLKRRRIMKTKRPYETPRLEILTLPSTDVLTASTPNTDLGPDIGEWDNEM